MADYNGTNDPNEITGNFPNDNTEDKKVETPMEANITEKKVDNAQTHEQQPTGTPPVQNGEFQAGQPIDSNVPVQNGGMTPEENSFYGNANNFPQANITENGNNPPQTYRWDFNDNNPAVQKTQYPQYQTKQKSNTPKFIVLILVILALVIGMIFAVTKTKKKNYKPIDPNRDDPFSEQAVIEPSKSPIDDAEDSGIESSKDKSKETSKKPNLKDDLDAVAGVKISPKETIEPMEPKDIYKKVVPSIVGIEVYMSNSINFEIGEGSGVIMNEDGYIITNAHVVENAAVIQVITQDGTSYEAELVGKDTQTDLAIIKIDARGLVPAEFGDSKQLEIGDSVYPLGNPGGMIFASSMTSGMVSGINRILPDAGGYAIPLIQTDAAINPGNSGGALVNDAGQVVGITSSKISGDKFEGLGFAIPIHEAKDILDELLYNGRISGRPMIGITYNPETNVIDEISSKLNGLPTGVIVQSVNVKSDAYAKGLKANDIIHKVGETEIKSAKDMQDSLVEYKAGDEITITIYRRSFVNSTEGEYIDITFTLMEQD